MFHIKRGKLDPPAWLEGATPEQRAHDPKNIIACQNGLLDISTRELLTPSPLFFTRTALAINYSKKPPKPERWLKFLHEVLGDDDAVIDFMQQAIGYHHQRRHVAAYDHLFSRQVAQRQGRHHARA